MNKQFSKKHHTYINLRVPLQLHLNIDNLGLNNKIILQMSKLKKGTRSKPNLFVQIEDFQKKIHDFKQGSGKNNVLIKPLCSDKNVHELKRFNFDDCHIDAVGTEKKIQKLQQLQEQKCTLMHSLEILKASAVSAIAEKEDEIERLKVIDHFSIEEKLEYYETELYRNHKLQQELEEEKEQLFRQFSEERSKHLSELEEKEYLIQAMHEEMSQIRRDLQNLQQNDIAKTKKIKILQEENSKLSIELEEISLTHSLTHLSDRMDLDQTIKMRAPSVISSIHSQHCFSLNESNEHIPFEGSYISQRIEEMNKGHKEDLMELKNFYEKRITALREIYERQLNLPTQESEKDESYSHNSQLTKKPSKRSLKRANQEHGLNINLKDMYSIEEHAEQLLQTERTKMNDLKYQIKMQNLSECPSVQPRLRTQQDMDLQSEASHFTAKYFEVPVNRFLKKNKSSSTFNPQESKTILKGNHKRSEDLKGEQEQLQSVECQQNFWSKTKIFAAGMLSGVTITALTAVLLRKN